MAITNHERVGKALDLLKDGLAPFVERELKAQHAQKWFEAVKARSVHRKRVCFQEVPNRRGMPPRYSQ